MNSIQNGKGTIIEKTKNLRKRLGIDGFTVMLLAVVFAAYLYPQAGLIKNPVSLEEIANYGLTLIFFFYGLRLNPANLYNDLKNWRMHIVTQLSTFLLFPIIVLLAKPLFTSEEAKLLWFGAFFLAALPSTVSSSVVMVSNAGGNIPSAIFNASISAILGIFITPLWVGLILTANSEGLEMSSIILKLFLQVLLPVFLGLLLHHFFGAFADKHKKKLRYFDQTIILLIIYTSFCHSFAENIFSGLDFSTLLLLAAAMISLFIVVFITASLICNLLGFSLADKITVVFCGSKKSLIHGTVMSKVLFQQSAFTGIILLPLMLYHAMQIIIISIIAQKYAGENNLENPAE